MVTQELYYNIESLPESACNGLLIIGSFDGVHKGHQAILQAAKQKSKTQGCSINVLIFDPHPRHYFAPDTPSLRLTTLETRAKLLKQYGADYVTILPFTKDIAEMSAEYFIKTIIAKTLKAKFVCIGHDFRFGASRRGNAKMLKHYSQIYGFETIFIEAVTPEHSPQVPYSSTHIRNCLSHGKIQQATKALGHYWHIESHVIKGDQRGREIGFPTANLPLTDYHLPLFGVYVVQTKINDKKYSGVANLGKRPTFELDTPLLEVHLFNFEENLYGMNLRIALVDFIRAEKKFNDLASLKKQINHDVKIARQLLAEHDSPC